MPPPPGLSMVHMQRAAIHVRLAAREDFRARIHAVAHGPCDTASLSASGEQQPFASASHPEVASWHVATPLRMPSLSASEAQDDAPTEQSVTIGARVHVFLYTGHSQGGGHFHSR